MLDILLGAADPEVARQMLSDRYGLIGAQVDVVMNLQFRRATQSDRGKIQHEIEELQQQLDRLLEQMQGERRQGVGDAWTIRSGPSVPPLPFLSWRHTSTPPASHGPVRLATGTGPTPGSMRCT
ncbi:hypothetical protein GCM10027026_17630 [Myroides odoratimimus subsp. xuanwuensis]